MAGRGFRLGPGRGDSGLGNVVAVESKEGANLRVPRGWGDGVVRRIPRAGLGCGWLVPFQAKTGRRRRVSLHLL